MHDLEGLAKRQAEICDGTEQAWYAALTECVECNECLKLSQDDFLLLLEYVKTPTSLAHFFRFWCDQCMGSDESTRFLFSKLIEHVDESAFSLSEWLDAISVFYQWLKRKNAKTDFIEALGYIECCCEQSQGDLSHASLPASVDHSLESFGFKRAIGV